jgi:predicted small metal-binding protein
MHAPDARDVATNRCACGWEVTGPIDEVVAATIDHGARMHNMMATREDVLAAMGRMPPSDEATGDRR